MAGVATFFRRVPPVVYVTIVQLIAIGQWLVGFVGIETSVLEPLLKGWTVSLLLISYQDYRMLCFSSRGGPVFRTRMIT